MGKAYFQGWYFKVQNKERTLAFIPARHTDEHGNTTASLQVITQSGAYTVSFPGYQYIEHENPFFIRLGHSFFSETGMELHITVPGISVEGQVKFQNRTPISYDIMGPFCYVPFMECRHSVFSMTHRVDGCLTINGEKYFFENGIGYIEGDRGRSFPKEYAWTQCNFQDGEPGSIMLSVAEIPLAGLHFTGVISAIVWKGKEYRLATYLGAKATHIADGAVTVRQGPYTLTARLLAKPTNAHPLQAPVAGSMTRLIRESPACKARYHFSRGGQTLFVLESDRAAFEYEYKK